MSVMLRTAPLAVLMTLLLPPLVYMVSTASSMTIGLTLCALIWIFVVLATDARPYTLQKSDAYALGLLACGISLLTLHAVICNYQIGGIDFARFFLSCVILAATTTGAHFAARKLEHVPDSQLVKAANLALISLTLLGIAAALGAPAIGARASHKPVVIFVEPSHFSLAYLPVLLFRVSIAKRSQQIALIGVALGLSLVLQSLTMLAGTLFVAALLLRRTPLVLMLAAVAVGALTLDLTYYSSRLVFSSETDNLSALVFMQGWDSAILNFRESAGLGVGFQQFGIAGSIGEIAEKIAEITGGEYLNLRDGGSTATKLIGEFGVAGIAALLVYLAIVWRAAKYVRKAQRQSSGSRDLRRLFFYAFVLAFALELFLRGTGYFTPGSFFALVALMSLSSAKKRTQDMNHPQASPEHMIAQQ